MLSRAATSAEYTSKLGVLAYVASLHILEILTCSLLQRVRGLREAFGKSPNITWKPVVFVCAIPPSLSVCLSLSLSLCLSLSAQCVFRFSCSGNVEGSQRMPVDVAPVPLVCTGGLLCCVLPARIPMLG